MLNPKRRRTHGSAFLDRYESKREAAERQRREEEAKRQAEAERLLQAKAREEAIRRKEAEEKAITQVPKAEILPPSKPLSLATPDSKSLALPPLAKDAIALPDLSHLEREMRSATDSMNLSVPEGFWDSWFGRTNHRIAVKSERGQLLAGYIAACTAILVEAEKVASAAGTLQRAKYQLYIDRLTAMYTALQLEYKLEFARRQVERQDAIEAAKADAVIAEYKARVRLAGLRGYPPPAPPPPPPPKPPEDPRAKNKARIEAEFERLRKDEAEAIRKATAGKNESDWSDAEKEEAMRIENMYDAACEEKREELRRYL